MRVLAPQPPRRRVDGSRRLVIVAEASQALPLPIVRSSGIRHRYVKHPMWEPQRNEAELALPVPPDLDAELDLIARWKSEDYAPPEN